MSNIVTLAGTDILFVELTKELKCAGCGNMTSYIDLEELNTSLRVMCSDCVKCLEGIPQ